VQTFEHSDVQYEANWESAGLQNDGAKSTLLIVVTVLLQVLDTDRSRLRKYRFSQQTAQELEVDPAGSERDEIVLGDAEGEGEDEATEDDPAELAGVGVG
jgi:hypothetical protein